MHVGVAYQGAERPAQACIVQSQARDDALLSESLGDDRPVSSTACELGIQGGEGVHGSTAQRSYPVEPLHLKEALSPQIQNAGGCGIDTVISQHLQSQVLGREEVAPALGRRAVLLGGELDDHMAWAATFRLHAGGEFGHLTTKQGAHIALFSGSGHLRIVLGAAFLGQGLRGRGVDEDLCRGMADDDVAGKVTAVLADRLQALRIAPVTQPLWKPQRLAVALGKGPTHVALRQGISNPPWKALAVRAVQLSQQHKPLRAHGHQQTLAENIAVLIDPEDGHLEMGA